MTLSVYAQSESATPRLGEVVQTYLDHLALRCETGEVKQDHFLNHRLACTRFAQAWRVLLADRRQAIVPFHATAVASADRRRNRGAPTPFRAGDPLQAIEQAQKLCAQSMTGPVLATICAAAPPSVHRNADWPLAQCTNDDLRRWIAANPQWRKGNTKHNNVAALIACFNWYEEEHGPKNPYRRKGLPKWPKESRREAEASEYVKLVGTCRTSREMRRALWCLWNVQGIRTCELRALLWSDFNWDGPCIVLNKHKTAAKTGKPRLIPLTPTQVRFFRLFYRQRPPWPDNVFLNTEGRPWTCKSFSLHLRRAAERLGLDENVEDKISAYCLRHSFATQAEEAGCDQQQTANLMGHGLGVHRESYAKARHKVRFAVESAKKIEDARRQARRLSAPPRPPKKPPTEIQGELF
jgi:integrase